MQTMSVLKEIRKEQQINKSKVELVSKRNPAVVCSAFAVTTCSANPVVSPETKPLAIIVINT